MGVRWGFATAVLLLVTVPGVRAGDEPIYDSLIFGTVDMIDHAHRTISVIPARPSGGSVYSA